MPQQSASKCAMNSDLKGSVEMMYPRQALQFPTSAIFCEFSVQASTHTSSTSLFAALHAGFVGPEAKVGAHVLIGLYPVGHCNANDLVAANDKTIKATIKTE